MITDTTTLSYWLNWRFCLCALWVITAMVVSTFVIWKYEGLSRSNRQRRENQEEKVGTVYKDEAWKTCLKAIHPGWLLGYRVFAFLVLSTMLIVNVVYDGGGIFYFYTQWTFALVTIYFGLGSAFSIYGCSHGYNIVSSDSEQGGQGSYVAPNLSGSSDMPKSSETREESYTQTIAGAWGYIFQIIYQMCAGSVMLTDTVFWLILYPLLTSDDIRLNFLLVGMHSVNAVFLLGDAALNNMRFPMFRITYFILWTGIFVLFQWIIHACVSLTWPYPFLDLSSPYAPLWYFGVGAVHVPLYVIFALLIRLKHFGLSRSQDRSSIPTRV